MKGLNLVSEVETKYEGLWHVAVEITVKKCMFSDGQTEVKPYTPSQSEQGYKA